MSPGETPKFGSKEDVKIDTAKSETKKPPKIQIEVVGCQTPPSCNSKGEFS